MDQQITLKAREMRAGDVLPAGGTVARVTVRPGIVTVDFHTPAGEGQRFIAHPDRRLRVRARS